MSACWSRVFLTLLAMSTCPRIAGRPNALMVAPTIAVGDRPQAEATIKCGKAGVLVYWHTPFGPLRTKLEPVHMRQDGSLLVHNVSHLHRGLYYCLLQHEGGGSTLFPYQLHARTQDGGQGAARFARALGKQETLSDHIFAGAVTAAVLLTFVLGFSAGALSRSKILRCLRTVTKRLPSPRQRPPHFTRTTLTSWPSSPSLPSSSSSSSCPPAKPQRSFRDKRSQDQEEDGNPAAAAYLEACDASRASGGRREEEERRRSKEEQQEGGVYVETMEEVERGEGDVEVKQEKRNVEVRKNRNDDEDEKSNKRDDEDEEKDFTTIKDQDQNQEMESSSPPRPSRVIRVYQYDQDGCRYGHLPDPEPGPRVKQRSISLTRLDAIMAAASSGPMDATPQKALFDVQF